jgi:hypothetical protein
MSSTFIQSLKPIWVRVVIGLDQRVSLSARRTLDAEKTFAVRSVMTPLDLPCPASFKRAVGRQSGVISNNEIRLNPSGIPCYIASHVRCGFRPRSPTGWPLCPKRASKVFKTFSGISQDLLERPMIKESKHFYEFGPFRVDPQTGLRDPLVLLQNSETVGLKDELMKSVSPGHRRRGVGSGAEHFCAPQDARREASGDSR